MGESWLAVQEQQGKGGEQPECLRGACQENPPIPVGAEEAEEEERRRNTECGVPAAAPSDPKQKAGRQEGVQNIGRAKPGQSPMISPFRGDNALPEKERGLGIPQSVFMGLKREQGPVGRGQA